MENRTIISVSMSITIRQTHKLTEIQQFFNTMPRLQHELEIENPKTKVKSKVVLSGLQSFFVSPSHMTA